MQSFCFAPPGFVSYISPSWGGRVSDEQINEESDLLLKNLLPGDTVLADCGFNVGDSEEFYCASLQIPAFTTEKDSELEKEQMYLFMLKRLQD